MSVGHVARLLEAANIATVIIGVRAFRERMAVMTLPRILITPHLMGRPMSAPGDRARQRETMFAALDLLENAQEVGTIVELEGAYWPT